MRRRVIERHVVGLHVPSVLQLGSAPRFLSAQCEHGNAFVFVEDDFNARPREPWTVVAASEAGGDPPDRSIFVGSVRGSLSWYHVYAYRGVPREEA